MDAYARIGDVCLVGDGTHSKIERHDCGVLYLTSRNFKDGSLDLSKVYYISERDYVKHFLGEGKALTLPRENDLVFSIIGTIGEPYLVRESDRFGISSSVAIIRPNRDFIDPTFLLHWFKGPVFQSALFGIKGGVAQGYVSLEMIRSLPVPTLPLQVQQRIAGILSAYDELIENNQRRICILEDMARSLYREWFVHFRYPGHESVPLIDSPLGQIPQGWEMIPFTEIANVLSGGTPKTDIADYWNGEIPFFTPRDAPDSFYVQDTDKHVTELGLTKCASQLYLPDTVFITARGTVGKVALPSVPMAMNQSCYALRGKAGISQRFLFLMTLQQLDYLKTNTGGATFDTIVVDTFRRMQVVKPRLDLITQFTSRINAVFEQVNTLERQTSNLRSTRDLLLPRLLSGQVTLATDTPAITA